DSCRKARGDGSSAQRQIGSHGSLSQWRAIMMVRAKVRGNHRHAFPNSSATTVPQQPKQAIHALPGANCPKRNRITQISQQREIRDASSSHTWITMALQISIVKHTQPGSAQDFSAA